MGISLKKNRKLEKLMLLAAAVFLMGGIYFLTAFIEWNGSREHRIYNYGYCLPVGLAGIAAFILMLILTLHLFKPKGSRVPMELRTLLTVAAILAVMLWVYIYYNCNGRFYNLEFLNINFRAGMQAAWFMLFVVCLPATCIISFMLYGFVAQIRGGCLLKSSLVYRIAGRFGRTESVRDIAVQYMIIAFECVLVFTPFFFTIGYWLVDTLDDEALASVIGLPVLFGCMLVTVVYIILLNGKHSLVRDADNAMKEAVERAVAGEKLKVELITNVSHDLRTPMTSIVGYGELLEGMELSDEARACVEKLNHKSVYLLSMLEDVFDMSKTATGNAVLDMAELDVAMLINQTIAECDDRLVRAGRKLCVDMDSDSVMVNTDGNRMHRVFSNLLDNAVKYSLAGTRIFVNLRTYEDRVVIEIMNTSSYEMNFTPERITERFVRGDSERTGEGSGIGLAIAKTYTEGVGGSFEVQLKGDLFSAIVTLPRK